MKRLFLSGGTGFFGKSILQRIAMQSVTGVQASDVTILSRDPQRFLDQYPQFKRLDFQFVQGDIREFKYPEERFDYIIHAATEASAKLERENPDEMYSVCVEGTEHMLAFAKQCGCKRFLLTSSGAVYGPQPSNLSHVSEDYPCAPITAYGRGKCIAEKRCIEVGEQNGFSALIARCFAFVGPYLSLDIHFAIGNFIRDCLANRTIIIQGDGTPLRSYLYSDDLVDWLFSIFKNGVHGRPYNIGSAESISIADLACRVRQCAQTDNSIEIKGQPVPGQAVMRYVPDVHRIQRELGVKQHIHLDEAIRLTLAWHRANG